MYAVFTACCSSAAQHTFSPAWVDPFPPCARYCRIASASGIVVTKPSPTRAASSIDFGPNPETWIVGGLDGSV